MIQTTVYKFDSNNDEDYALLNAMREIMNRTYMLIGKDRAFDILVVVSGSQASEDQIIMAYTALRLAEKHADEVARHDGVQHVREEFAELAIRVGKVADDLKTAFEFVTGRTIYTPTPA